MAAELGMVPAWGGGGREGSKRDRQKKVNEIVEGNKEQERAYCFLQLVACEIRETTEQPRTRT